MENYLRRPEEFVYIKYRTPNGVDYRWAVKLTDRTYRLVTEEGTNPDGGNKILNNILLVDPQDILSEQTAVLNVKYGKLEVGNV